MSKEYKTAGHKYNGAIDRLRVKENNRHIIGDKQGVLFTHDLFQPIPPEFETADYVVCDPPWNNGLMKGFYIKAEKTIDKTFADLLDRMFEIIKALDVKDCYMEIGKQAVKNVEERMKAIFPSVKVIESKYYNKYPCYFVIGEQKGHEIALEAVVKDELDVIDEIISKQTGTVLDFCCGRGAVSRSAYKHSKSFVCSDLNINRLAVAIEDIIKMGGKMIVEE